MSHMKKRKPRTVLLITSGRKTSNTLSQGTRYLGRDLKLTVAQLDKKYPTIYRSQNFITVFTRACHRSLSWAKWIQSTYSSPNFPKI